MIRFKDLLEEQFKRGRGIQHLTQMKPLEFLELIKEIKDKLGSKLKFPEVKITEKVDGAALTIGLDENQKFFIQTARSDKVYSGSVFVEFAKQKNRPLEIANAYKELFDYLKNHKKLQTVLKKYWVPSGYGIRGEVFWIGLAQEIKDNKIRFVAIEYDKSKIGEKLTFIMFKALTLSGEKHPKEEDLFKELKSISDREIKFFTPEIYFDEIDVSYIVKKVDTLIKSYPQIKEILTSRKKKDRELKEVLTKLIQELQKELASKIITIANPKFGDEFEGVVIDILGKQYKIQSDIFRKKKFGG